MSALDISQQEAAPSAPQAAVSDDDEFSSRATADQVAFEDSREATPLQHKKHGYATILIIALISLLLLGATGFFIYSMYLKPTQPTDASPPPE
jgi:hypothetical protein